MKMNGMFKSIGALALVALSLAGCEMPEIEIGDPDFSQVKMGSYEGYWDGGLVKVRVAVEAEDGRVGRITILLHDCGTGKPAEAIVDSVIDAQSLRVDVVSGATHSSKVILRAIENALTGS